MAYGSRLDLPLPLISLHRASTNHCSEPPALRLTPIMCHLPRTAWQKVCNRPSGSTCIVSLCAKTTPLVPIELEMRPSETTPVPTPLAALSLAPPTTTQSVVRPSSLAAASVSLPVPSSDS